LILAGFARADVTDSVVMLPSHGGSGTVIFSEPGRTIILSCAHMFQGRDRSKPLKFDVPHPTPGQPQSAKARVLSVDYRADLSLIELPAGPLPYVAPVAPPGYRPGNRIVAVGYDEMKQPPQKRPTQILREEGGIYWTIQRPWHGRSGGGLIDTERGWCVGVCHAYTGPPNHRELHRGAEGMYVSHQAICSFLRSAGWPLPSSTPQPFAQPSPLFQQLAAPPRAPGRVEIPMQFRLPNRTGDQCVWVSLATLARFHGIARGAPLASHGGLAGPGQPEAELRRLGIRFRSQNPGNRDTAILRDAIDRGLGAMIGLGGRHAVVVVGLDGGTLTVIENSDPKLGTRTLPVSAWDGWAIVLYPDGSDGARQQPNLQPAPQQRYYRTPQQQQPAPCPGGR
jgi:hypothetical protein